MHYNICFTDQDGNLTREMDVICHDDVLATLAAQSMLGAEDIEIWEYERKVVRLSHKVEDRSAGKTPLSR